MKLDHLLRLCFFEETDCRAFLIDNLDIDSAKSGTDVWHSTQGPWKNRSFEVTQELERRGLVQRRLFEALLQELPNRADDIAAACRTATGEPLNYAVGEPPPTELFAWAEYRPGMSQGLISLLRWSSYDARTRGYKTVSTSEIVRVYLQVQPWVATALAAAELDRSDLDGEIDPFEDGIGASLCVAKTIHGLARHTENPSKFTEHDVFLDLVRFGSGTSARKLVPTGEAIDMVNAMSRTLGIGRITRHGPLEESAPV